jgi:predicted Zn-dependent protease
MLRRDALPPPPSPGACVSVRVVDDAVERLSVRRSAVEPIETTRDRGAMVTVRRRRGIGYASTADLSAAGLRRAAESADRWAELVERHGVFDGAFDLRRPSAAVGAGDPPVCREGPVGEPMPSRAERIDLLRAACEAMAIDPRIVSRSARLRTTRREQCLYVDGELRAQEVLHVVEPGLDATAAERAVSQTRSLGGQYNGLTRQGGFEVVRASGLPGAGARIADEALQLLAAPECPTGVFDLLLAPDQMMLQIHETIGHPLELDRILGDERNFAGGSFVTLDLFGRYAYGSPLLNVTFDPGTPQGAAGYAVDDDGEPARKVWLIRDGVLLRPLGGALSRARAAARGIALEGTASARAAGWHRPPIDRMANLDIEPGDTPFDAMVASVERGVLMSTNASWSIDDARNKFQFGCEWGRLIEDGRLTAVVRNPGYRGISASFWRSLVAVGDAAGVEVHGTPYCGKGEPGQVVRVGHASPPCLFRGIDVFGGG